MKDKIVLVIAVGALILGVYVVFFVKVPSQPVFPAKGLGAAGGLLAENYDPYIMYNGGFYTNKVVKIGSNGSDVSELKATTCTFVGMDTSQVATSTVPYDCAVTGLASGDVVFAQLATSSSMAPVVTNVSWLIRSCHASTTADYLTCDISNFTGTARAPGADQIGSSTNIFYIDN